MSREYIIRIVVDTESDGKSQRRRRGDILATLGNQWTIGPDNDNVLDDLIKRATLLHAQCQDAERELLRVKEQLAAERARRRAAEAQLRRLTERELLRVKEQLAAERARRRAAEVQLSRLNGDKARPEDESELE